MYYISYRSYGLECRQRRLGAADLSVVGDSSAHSGTLKSGPRTFLETYRPR